MDQIRKNEIIAVILFAVSLFLFLSIFTFSEQDLSFYTSSPNAVFQNATGIVGAYIGGFLVFFAGKAGYVIPLIVMIWGLSRLLQLDENKLSLKIFGTVVLVAAVSSILSMMSDSSTTMAFAGGGLVGSLVSSFLLEYLGRVGATVFIIAMTVLSVLIATEFLILPVIVRSIRFLWDASQSMQEWFSEKLEEIRERREAANDGKNKIETAKEEIAKKLQKMRVQVEESRKVAFAKRQKKEDEFEEYEEEEEYEDEIIPKPRKARPREAKRAHVRPVRVTPAADGSTGTEVDYNMPSLDLFKESPKGFVRKHEEGLKRKAATLERTLLEFGVEAKVVKINKGPVITMYELEPAMGTRVNKVTSLADNISLAMKSANIRILAPIPGKGTIGIEVPNDESELVLLRDILEAPEYLEEESPLKFALGKDVAGAFIVSDLAKMPHLLIAGATGSGKTVCINAIVSSFLYNSSPEEIKFLMIDPKRVELMMYEGLPHLVAPIITNPKKAASSLNWAIHEMERRYEMFAEKGVRNIAKYKSSMEDDDENLPYIVIIVDELADLMVVAQQDVEGAIMRIAQLARAAGIHLILATQRPSVNVITGVIKANFPARISFKVASKVDSRTVLDANGAEKLLGRGDMLFMEPGKTSFIRGQCSLVEDSEIKDLVGFINEQAGPQYIEEAVEKQEKRSGGVEQEKDDLYHDAVEMVLATKQASVSMIQRKFRVGYTRAARMIDIMEEEGVVGPYNGSKPRDILVDDIDDVEEMEEE